MNPLLNAENAKKVIDKRKTAFLLLVPALIYSLQMASPLRIGGDAKAYLSMALSSASGLGLYHGREGSHFPPGYPFLLSGVIRFGFMTSAAVVALNILMLAIALVCIKCVLRVAYGLDNYKSVGICTGVLFSYLFFQYTVRPYSEMTFLAVSMLSLFCLSMFESLEKGIRWPFFATGCASVAGAILVRTAGVALLPALLWAIISKTKIKGRLIKSWHGNITRRTACILFFLAFVAVFFYFLTRSTYYQEMALKYKEQGLLPLFGRTLTWRMTEWGQIAANLPYTYTPVFLRKLFPVVGLFALAAFAAGFMRRDNYNAVDIYVLFYALLIFFWPYWDARFWIPIIPLAAVYISGGISRLLHRRALRHATMVYAGLFVLKGAVGLIYNTRLSLSRTTFPKRYAYPGLKETYEVAWGQKSESEAAVLDSEALELLRTLEPQAKAR